MTARDGPAAGRRLVIADPPYLGRGKRFYGVGAEKQSWHRKASGTRVRTSTHPEAEAWDDPDTHRELVARLGRDYDGWAVAAASDSLAVYLGVCPHARVAVWHTPNGVPGGSHIRRV